MQWRKYIKYFKGLLAKPQARRNFALAVVSLIGGAVLAVYWTVAPPPANLQYAGPQVPHPAAEQNAEIVPPPAVSQPSPAPAVAPAPPPEPAWKRNAVALQSMPSGPMIAIVLDDMGPNRKGTRRALDLPAPITFAFLPYAAGVAGDVALARKRGHEIIVHVPMEPKGDADPGPRALRVAETPDQIRANLVWDLDQFDGYVGINNHMGSRFTADAKAMRVVMEELKARGLMFLDSRTGPDTQAANVARELGLPTLSRDVFLDNDEDGAKVAAQFDILEKIARKYGAAIAIGHPHPETLAVLEKWIPQARERGFTLVPLTSILKYHQAS